MSDSSENVVVFASECNLSVRERCKGKCNVTNILFMFTQFVFLSKEIIALETETYFIHDGSDGSDNCSFIGKINKNHKVNNFVYKI